MQSKIFSILLGITGSILFTQCASYRTTATYPEARPLGRHIKTYAASEQLSEGDTTFVDSEAPTGEITLRQALSLALLRNPDLAAFSWEVRAREAGALQAGLLPNPEIELELENFGGSGETGGLTQSEATIQLSQLIELGGKRRKRARVAALETDLAAWDYETARLDILTEITKTFVDVLSAQERVALNEELAHLAEQFADIVSKRVEAGRTSLAEEARARVAQSNARIELDRARRELEAARRRLAATWGSPSARFKLAAGKLEASMRIPDEEKLRRLADQNPEVARWAVEMQRRRATVALEDARRIPDPTIAGGFRRLGGTGDNAFVMSLGIPLPIHDRNQGATAEARLHLTKGAWERRAVELRISTFLAEAYRDLSTAFNEATTLGSSILPQATKAFDTINQGYAQGKFGFLEVLDAQRTLFDSREQYLRALTEYRKAAADLERLIGQRLDAIK